MKKIVFFYLLLILVGCQEAKKPEWEFVGTRNCVIYQFKENALEKFVNGVSAEDRYSVDLDLYRIQKEDKWIYGLMNDEGKIYTEQYPMPSDYESNLNINNFRYNGTVYTGVIYNQQ